jgi:hypothetical protein
VTELEYMEPLCTVFESGSTTIMSLAPCAKAPSIVCGTWISFDHCSAADRVAVQGVDDRIAPGLLAVVAGWQKDDHVAVDGVALQVAFEGGAVDLDALDADGLCAGNHRRHVRSDLRRQPRRQSDEL